MVFLSSQERTSLRQCLRLLGLNRGRFWASVLTGSAGLASAIALSAVAAWLIARASEHPDVVMLGVAPVMVRLFGISRAVLRYVERLISHDTALRGMNGLRTRVYQALAGSRADVVAALRRGDVLARMGADIDAVGDLVVRAYLPAAVALVSSLLTVVAIAFIYPPAALILALCLAISGIGAPLVTMRATRRALDARRLADTQLANATLNLLENADELRINGTMETAQNELAQIEQRIIALKDSAARPGALAGAIDIAATLAAVIGAILVGSPAVASGSLNPVMLAVITLTPLAAFEATAPLGPASTQLIVSAQAATRVMELVDQARQAADEPSHELAAPGAELSLRARNLATAWPGGPIISQGIDLEVKPGQSLAIVGSSGIGKTTLLYTLAGILPSAQGSVEVLTSQNTWQPLYGSPRQQAAAYVSLTAEDAHIFNTSVLENLRVAKGDITAEQAYELLEQAGLGAWVSQLPKGLDTVLGSGATSISGGERRRLLLARALASPARILLLDEPGEHLDPATADALIADLLQADSKRAIVLVTHRLSALASADEVVLLGKENQTAHIVARGSHSQLLATSNEYAWALAQEESSDE